MRIRLSFRGKEQPAKDNAKRVTKDMQAEAANKSGRIEFSIEDSDARAGNPDVILSLAELLFGKSESSVNGSQKPPKADMKAAKKASECRTTPGKPFSYTHSAEIEKAAGAARSLVMDDIREKIGKLELSEKREERMISKIGSAINNIFSEADFSGCFDSEKSREENALIFISSIREELLEKVGKIKGNV